MTEKEQRIAIAEACGWIIERKLGHGCWIFTATHKLLGTCTGNAVASQTIMDKAGVPDYLNDLNAIHEAEKVLTHAEKVSYYYEVITIVCAKAIAMDFYSLCATAQQRAEAFLRTIGKWKD